MEAQEAAVSGGRRARKLALRLTDIVLKNFSVKTLDFDHLGFDYAKTGRY